MNSTPVLRRQVYKLKVDNQNYNIKSDNLCMSDPVCTVNQYTVHKYKLKYSQACMKKYKSTTAHKYKVKVD